MRAFETTLNMIGFSSIHPVGSTQWEKEANNFYADWMINCSDKEYERIYPPPKFIRITSIVEITGNEFNKLERLYGDR